MGYHKVIISQFGGSDVLKLVEESSLPEPGPDEVRIKVLATSAAFTDIMIREGKYPDVNKTPPFSPGYDMVGVVDGVGEAVRSVQLGQKVADLTVTGAYSEYLCLPANRLTPMPDHLDSAEAVSLILSYMTAYQMLHRVANIQKGQRILIHGAGGAVGTAMIQLGKLMNLTVYGTASKPKHDLIAELGAIPIDYREEDWLKRLLNEEEGGIDAVFDPIGGDTYKHSFRALRKGGTLVGYGFYNAVMGKGGHMIVDFIRLKLWDLLPNGKSTAFYSIQAMRAKHPNWFLEDLEVLFDLLSQGQIKPVIAKLMPLREAKHAHELIEQANVQGKIVLTMNQSP